MKDRLNSETHIPLYRANTLKGLLKKEVEVLGYYKETPKGKHIITDRQGKEHEIDILSLQINFDAERPQCWSNDWDMMFLLQFNALTTSYYSEFYTISQSGDGFYQQTGLPIESQEHVFNNCKYLEDRGISTKVFHNRRVSDITTTLKEYEEDISAIGFMKV